ncbi:MAG TPA: hypothetical protein VIL48_19285 [Acidimicrobiales bacterium]
MSAVVIVIGGLVAALVGAGALWAVVAWRGGRPEVRRAGAGPEAGFGVEPPVLGAPHRPRGLRSRRWT